MGTKVGVWDVDEDFLEREREEVRDAGGDRWEKEEEEGRNEVEVDRSEGSRERIPTRRGERHWTGRGPSTSEGVPV